MTELALDTVLTPTQRGYLDMVKSSGDSLLTLINDILDLSRIEAGKLELRVSVFGLRAFIGDVGSGQPEGHDVSTWRMVAYSQRS